MVGLKCLEPLNPTGALLDLRGHGPFKQTQVYQINANQMSAFFKTRNPILFLNSYYIFYTLIFSLVEKTMKYLISIAVNTTKLHTRESSTLPRLRTVFFPNFHFC